MRTQYFVMLAGFEADIGRPGKGASPEEIRRYFRWRRLCRFYGDWTCVCGTHNYRLLPEDPERPCYRARTPKGSKFGKPAAPCQFKFKDAKWVCRDKEFMIQPDGTMTEIIPFIVWIKEYAPKFEEASGWNTKGGASGWGQMSTQSGAQGSGVTEQAPAAKLAAMEDGGRAPSFAGFDGGEFQVAPGGLWLSWHVHNSPS